MYVTEDTIAYLLIDHITNLINHRITELQWLGWKGTQEIKRNPTPLLKQYSTMDHTGRSSDGS